MIGNKEKRKKKIYLGMRSKIGSNGCFVQQKCHFFCLRFLRFDVITMLVKFRALRNKYTEFSERDCSQDERTSLKMGMF